MSGTSGWTDRAGALSSFAIPFGLALSHVGSSPAWGGDLALLRGLAGVGLSGQGMLGALFTRLVSFVPLGTTAFRAAALSALALGGVGWAVYHLARRLLEANARTPRLSAALSVIAAMAATSGATAQREGTVAGGAALAVLVALVLLLLLPGHQSSGARGAIRIGALWGALATESLALALLWFLAAAGGAVAERRRASRATLVGLAGGAALAVVVLLLPMATAPFAPSFLELGRAVADLGPSSLERAARGGGSGLWLSEMGVVPIAWSAIGCAVGLWRGRLRSHVVPLVAALALDRLAALREGIGFAPADLAPAHLFAVAALAIAAALATQATATLLDDMKLPMARGAAVFLVMFNLALVVAAAEEASFAADRSAMRGAEAFTDDALLRLAPGAAVLVRSQPLALRLWSARATEGARPDVLVIPMRILGKGRIALGLLRDEPEVQGLIRDVSIEGRPLEHALTALADVRPLEVELDPAWDRRITSHLTSDHFWLRFAPEPLGPSDRRAALAAMKPRMEMVLQASRTDDQPDEMTESVVGARLKDYAAVATVLGDKDELAWLTEALHKVEKK
jgi:hypothetical protein